MLVHLLQKGINIVSGAEQGTRDAARPWNMISEDEVGWGSVQTLSPTFVLCRGLQSLKNLQFASVYFHQCWDLGRAQKTAKCTLYR